MLCLCFWFPFWIINIYLIFMIVFVILLFVVFFKNILVILVVEFLHRFLSHLLDAVAVLMRQSFSSSKSSPSRSRERTRPVDVAAARCTRPLRLSDVTSSNMATCKLSLWASFHLAIRLLYIQYFSFNQTTQQSRPTWNWFTINSIFFPGL